MGFQLKPNPDKSVEGKPLQVVDPMSGEALPAGGKTVPKSVYWHRRLRDGDVVHCEVLTKMSLGEAITHCLERGGALLTGSGVPKCDVLSELTGREISAAERNAALQQLED